MCVKTLKVGDIVKFKEDFAEYSAGTMMPVTRVESDYIVMYDGIANTLEFDDNAIEAYLCEV